MHCKSCGFVNGEDDHRCLRCGRRISGIVIAAPADYNPGALALAPSYESEPVRIEASGQTAMFDPAVGAAPGRPLSNLIEFDRHPRGAQPVSPAAKKPVAKKILRTPVEQPQLPIEPTLPVRARMLKTEVEAQIFCDRPVATPTHRCVASALDGAIILLGFGVLVLIFFAMGGNLGEGPSLWLDLAAVLALVSVFYGLIWVIAGRETAGMRWTDLELITFDGQSVDGPTRALRFASSWLSFGSGALGLVWALADEESLTWHDHISKTFPAARETTGSFVRARR